LKYICYNLIYKYCKQLPFSALAWRHVLAWLEILATAFLRKTFPWDGCIKSFTTRQLRRVLLNKVVASSHHFLFPFLSWNRNSITLITFNLLQTKVYTHKNKLIIRSRSYTSLTGFNEDNTGDLPCSFCCESTPIWGNQYSDQSPIALQLLLLWMEYKPRYSSLLRIHAKLAVILVCVKEIERFNYPRNYLYMCWW